MKRWKHILLTTASGVALAGSAQAADMAMKGPSPIASIPYANWTGFYIGGHVGVGSAQNTCSPGNGGSDYNCAWSDENSTQLANDTNLLAGVQAGYDWQDRYFVYGVAADWTWTNLKSTAFSASGSTSWESRVNWLASFRGRAGLALDTNLIYVTGGVAIGQFEDKEGIGKPTGPVTDTNTQVGWVAGAGIEHKFNANWSVLAEYLHYDFGTYTVNFSNDDSTYSHDFTHKIDVGRVGLNYRW